MSSEEQQKDLQEFLGNAQKALEKYSVKELNEAIIVALNQKDGKKNEISHVFDIVCEDYKVTRRVLMSNSQAGEAAKARCMAYCLLHINLGIPMRQITKRIFTGRWHNSVAVAIKYFRALNVSIKPDKEFKERYDRLESILSNRINKQEKNIAHG